MKLRISSPRVCVLVLSLVLMPLARAGDAAVGEHPVTAQWNFRVFLDDSEIGYHRFSLIENGDRLEVATEADFRVRFLFFTAYEYSHVNREVWQGDCLEAMRSATDANGRHFSVTASRAEDGFTVDTGDARLRTDGCVKSFAYWDPAILEASALLNAQTGELMPVAVEEVALEAVEVRGQTVPARRYRLTAHGLELDIWYSEDDRWLALQSTVDGGRTLRYVLS